ncbi:D-ribose pyranase [Thiospirochaeta perfilievii]|uniref:D-ribose pyranase n=1 Tax=Thiospirochaeta perfilievii TaxID=252967 RepID=A0A5C1QCX2_9SPIO|nr:D-ribose pyranase [Thiospirochaeta perfilievii]QEN05198.1 D-ribose pyranase [Thiospirochaeta perfilievii]
MKRGLLLNSRVSSVISKMGHTDSLTIADAGLPIPDSTERIDLALKAGIPAFSDVLSTVLSELCVERVVLANEIKDFNPTGLKEIENIINRYEKESGFTITIEFMPHENFKHETTASNAVIRTGEIKPYANIILYSGVVF